MTVPKLVRWVLFGLGVVVGVAILSACKPPPPTEKLVVTTTADAFDADVGDGICEATVGAGDCTLRAAIQEANASPIRADITVPPWTYQLTSAGGTNLSLDPASGNVVIHAPQPGAQVLGAPSNDARVFALDSGTATVSGIGFAGSPNYIVAGDDTTLTVAAVSADELDVSVGATVHAFDSSFDGDINHGGVISSGTFEARFSTMTLIFAGDSSSTSVGASIIRNGCYGPVTSLGYNLVPVASPQSINECTPGVGDVASSSMSLSRPSGDDLWVRVPQVGSPALDSIPVGVGPCAGTPPSDIHGNPRPTHGACDRGAVEAQSPRSFTVTSSVDARDAAPGDGTCRTAAGVCSLRAAVDETNHRADAWAANTITLGAAPTLTVAGAGEDGNASGDFDLMGPVTIEGNGYTIDAHQLDRVLDHRNGTLTVRHLGIAGGKVTGPDSLGGGVRGSVSTVVLEDDTLSGNTLVGSNIFGAGVGIDGGTIVARRSTFSGNSAGGYTSSGGAIYGRGSLPQQDTIEVSNSTFVGNTAFSGAAIDNVSGTTDDPISVRSSTFVGNFGSTQLGGIQATTVAGSVFSGGSGFCLSQVVSLGWNVGTAGDACFLKQSTDLVVSDPLLGPLASNGGPTQTVLPQVGSPVLDRIPVGAAGLCDSSVTIDQRGSVRPHGIACDAGAVER